MSVHTALFTRAKRWEQPKCPSMGEWINKMQYISKQQNITIHKKDWNTDICSNVDEPRKHNAWVKEAGKRLHIVIVYLYEIFKAGKSKETESRWVVAQGWRRGLGSDYLMGMRCSSGITKTRKRWWLPNMVNATIATESSEWLCDMWISHQFQKVSSYNIAFKYCSHLWPKI